MCTPFPELFQKARERQNLKACTWRLAGSLVKRRRCTRRSCKRIRKTKAYCDAWQVSELCVCVRILFADESLNLLNNLHLSSFIPFTMVQAALKKGQGDWPGTVEALKTFISIHMTDLAAWEELTQVYLQASHCVLASSP
jgi:hypothetical protein